MHGPLLCQKMANWKQLNVQDCVHIVLSKFSVMSHRWLPENAPDTVSFKCLSICTLCNFLTNCSDNLSQMCHKDLWLLWQMSSLMQQPRRVMGTTVSGDIWHTKLIKNIVFFFFPETQINHSELMNTVLYFHEINSSLALLLCVCVSKVFSCRYG